MKKQIENKENLINLSKTLEKFFDCDDECYRDCNECRHKRLCDEIYRLNTTLRMRYLREIKNK